MPFVSQTPVIQFVIETRGPAGLSAQRATSEAVGQRSRNPCDRQYAKYLYRGQECQCSEFHAASQTLFPMPFCSIYRDRLMSDGVGHDQRAAAQAHRTIRAVITAPRPLDFGAVGFLSANGESRAGSQAARSRKRTGSVFRPRRMTLEALRSSCSGVTASSIESTLFTISLIAHFISWRASIAPRQ